MTDSDASKNDTTIEGRSVLAIVAGGAGGLLLQSATITAYLGVPYMKLITTWGRYVVAIMLVALFAAFWRALPRAQAVGLSLAAGIVIPTMLSRYMFASTAPWSLLIAFNLTFTVLALIVWRLASVKSDS